MATDPNLYKIVATPELRTVTPGAEVTYYCTQRYDTISSPDGPHDDFQWYCYNDRAMAEELHRPYIVKGPQGRLWEKAVWSFVGRHSIRCIVTAPDENRTILEYPQWVDTEEAILEDFLWQHEGSPLPHPVSELSVVSRYIEVLRTAEAHFPITDSGQKAAHDTRIRQLEEYRDRLKEVLASTEGALRVPFAAAHVAVESQEKRLLRVFLACTRQTEDEQTWQLVDWTNPTHRLLTGIYEGSGRTAEDAIRSAIRDWDRDNRYFDGTADYHIPDTICGHPIDGLFETNGAGAWDTVASWLTYIGLGAAVVAGVVTLVAPVPGSQVVSGLIWASLLTSTGAAVINIGQRWDEGFSNWKEDSFDTLAIVGNVLGVGWLRCAKVIGIGRGASKARYILIGQVATDGVQGVLIAEDSIGKYDAIMNDTTLTPEERTNRLLELFRSLVIDGAMLYVSMKGTKGDLENLQAGKIPKENLERLKDPKQEARLRERATIEGETNQKRVKGTAQDEQRRPRKQKRGKQTVDPTVTPLPGARGMRPGDHEALTDIAREKKLIILVRDSNSSATGHINRKHRKPKPPELMYGKSRKTPPNAGLVALDPADPRVLDAMRQQDLTYPQLKAKLWKDGRFTVASADEGYIIRDADNNAFYSDYDLHGVYDEAGKDAYTPKLRDELNGAFDVEEGMIQHGPLDQYPKRNDPANPVYGPQPPVTAYMPDGSTVHLGAGLDKVADIAALKQFYQEHGIPWECIYPNH